MAAAAVSDIALTIPLFSSATSNSSPQNVKGISSPGAASATGGAQIAVDTISISEQSRQVLNEVKKEDALTKEATTQKTTDETAPQASSNGKSGGAAAKVQFVYNMRGDLSVKYFDAANRLVYQVPSELMMRQMEMDFKTGSSVDTKA
ncbi:MAG: hypothetical protein WCI45_13280 [Desulfuromonadales bacterium]